MAINKKKIHEELVSLSSLHDLVQTYQEIAATRMRKVKSNVLKNREFLSELNMIFQEVKIAYQNKNNLLKLKKRKYKPVIQKNGKSVSVLLSSNTMLYGDIIRKVANKFIESALATDADLVVIGKVGLRFYKDSGVSKPHKYFELSDTGIDQENLKRVVDYVIEYENINVFHARFEDILIQSAQKTLISEDLIQDPEYSVEINKYIFEPSIEKILSFFEAEILASIFEQSVNESNLSKFASRMVTLDYALENIDSRISRTNFEKIRLKHRLHNIKQQDVLSGMQLWRIN